MILRRQTSIARVVGRAIKSGNSINNHPMMNVFNYKGNRLGSKATEISQIGLIVYYHSFLPMFDN